MSKIILNGSIDPDRKKILKQIIELFFCKNDNDCFSGEIDLQHDIEDLNIDGSVPVEIVKSVRLKIDIEKTNPIEPVRAFTKRNDPYGWLI